MPPCWRKSVPAVSFLGVLSRPTRRRARIVGLQRRLANRLDDDSLEALRHARDRRASVAQSPSANTTSVKVGESGDRAVHDPFLLTSADLDAVKREELLGVLSRPTRRRARIVGLQRRLANRLDR
jgi:hypothetical protein